MLIFEAILMQIQKLRKKNIERNINFQQAKTINEQIAMGILSTVIKPFSNCLQFCDFPTQFLQSESFVISQMIRDYSVTKCFACCLTSRHA